MFPSNAPPHCLHFDLETIGKVSCNAEGRVTFPAGVIFHSMDLPQGVIYTSAMACRLGDHSRADIAKISQSMLQCPQLQVLRHLDILPT